MSEKKITWHIENLDGERIGGEYWTYVDGSLDDNDVENAVLDDFERRFPDLEDYVIVLD